MPGLILAFVDAARMAHMPKTRVVTSVHRGHLGRPPSIEARFTLQILTRSGGQMGHCPARSGWLLS